MNCRAVWGLGKTAAGLRMRLPSALIKRDVVIGHGQNHCVYRSAVDRPHPALTSVELGFPVKHVTPEGSNIFEKDIFELAIPLHPGFSAQHVLRRRGVKIAIGEPLITALIVLN